MSRDELDIVVLCKLWRTATLIAHTTGSKQEHQTVCTSQKKDYILLNPYFLKFKCKHSFSQDKINNLMT